MKLLAKVLSPEPEVTEVRVYLHFFYILIPVPHPQEREREREREVWGHWSVSLGIVCIEHASTIYGFYRIRRGEIFFLSWGGYDHQNFIQYLHGLGKIFIQQNFSRIQHLLHS